jgi:hypothetical protein
MKPIYQACEPSPEELKAELRDVIASSAEEVSGTDYEGRSSSQWHLGGARSGILAEVYNQAICV